MAICNRYAVKTSSKRIIQKTAEVTGDLIGNKTAELQISELQKSQEVHRRIIQKEL